MNIRRPHLWLIGALLCGVVALAVGLRRARTPSRETPGVLEAAPPDAWLLVTVDVAAARPLLKPFLESAGGLATATRAAGLGSLTDACGFDPVEHVRELMVAAPEGGERGDFGIAFSADLSRDELAGCARKAIAARGGSPSTTTRGQYAVIGDDAAPGQARLAYRDRGPFLVGRGAWLDAMIDAAGGHSAPAPSWHQTLRAALAPPGEPPRALVVTGLLPKAVRDRLKASEAEAGAGPSPAFGGVLGVEEAGAAVTVSNASTALELQLRCESPAACGEVKELIERGKRSLSSNLGVRLMGFGPLIDGVAIDSTVAANGASGANAANAPSLVVKTRAPTADLAQALAKALGRPAREPAR